MEFDHLTLDGLKAAVHAHYKYATACFRALGTSLNGRTKAQKYTDTTNYLGEAINALEVIREMTKEIERRKTS